VTFDADLGWQHLYGDPTPKSVFAFDREKVTIRGADLNKDAAILGLSVGVKLSDKAKLNLKYDGELGAQSQSHEGQMVLEVGF
jgi:outer membrane autotransporter protein